MKTALRFPLCFTALAFLSYLNIKVNGKNLESVSMDEVIHRCAGKGSCQFPASNHILRDVYGPTRNYLEVGYQCKREIMTATGCEGTNLSLGCPAGQAINVLSAKYGHDDGSDLCPQSSFRQNENECEADSGLVEVKNICHGENSCQFLASNNILGNPCGGINKYFEVKYQCLQPAVSEMVCEHRTIRLECPSGQIINVESANYGRYKGADVCPHPTIKSEEYLCEAKSSLKEAQNRCDGESSCQVPAKNNIFGDPCRGIYKYLEVNYNCIDVPINRTEILCEGFDLSLQCASGQSMEIQFANLRSLRVKSIYGDHPDHDICDDEGIED